ncbi:hypothetical protein GCM10027055_22810 [Janibacter alkaliphilus]|uniref:Glutamate transport system substrate-binding protein n=2 Tax=Janibacter alkaliphilus TaxID=1069963 RepID=A0A852XJB1_9MICO|nr:glutamate ABC transporter substrate-binding protein [Janibacter alkaliphilus]NYG38411.1 glutamate transport system substrate-binding protein [Janibacter alkaliphilus]
MVLALTATLVAACSRDVAVEPTTPTGSTAGATSTATPTGSGSNAGSGSSTADGTSSTVGPADVPDTLRVGISFSSPGIGERSNGRTTGLDADVARYVAQAIGADQVSFVNALPNQRETLLETDQVDMVVSSYSMTPERAQRVTFAGPYLNTGQDLLVSERSAVRGPEDLLGFTICAAEGSTSTSELVDDYPGLHVVLRPTVDACVDMLIRGEVKAVTSDAAILAGYARISREPNQLLLAGQPFTTERWGIALPKGDVALCQEVTTALRRMISSGAWEEAVEDHLGESTRISGTTLQPPMLGSCAAREASASSSSSSSSASASSASSSAASSSASSSVSASRSSASASRAAESASSSDGSGSD